MPMHHFMAIVKSEYYQEETNSLYGNMKTEFSHILYTVWSCSFLTYALIMGVQMGEISKLG
jgi:hypothetical protein